MFCPNCGNQLGEDARFCAACGARVGEENPGVPVAEAAPVAPAVPGLGAKLKEILVGYCKSPKEAAAAVAADGNFAMAGIFAGVNFLAVFFFLWRFVGAYITKLASLAEEDIAEYIENMEIAYPILPMLLAALAITVIGLGAAVLVKFLIAKLSKQELNAKQLCIAQAIHTLIPTALLVVGILLSFLVWWFLVVVLGIVVVLWIVGLCNELEQGENHLIPAGVIAVVLIVAVLLTGVLANWSFGELAHDDETLNEAREEYLEMIKDADGIFNGETVIDNMIDTLIMVDYR